MKYRAHLNTARQSRWLIPRTGLILIVSAVLIAATISILSYVNSRNQAAADAELHRLTQRDLEIESLLRLLVDTETGQRGFLLTGQEQFLDPYRNAIENIDVHYNALRSLVRLPVNIQRMDILRPLIDQRLALAKETIDLVRAGQTRKAIDIVRSGRGKQLLDQIRNVCADVRATATQRFLSVHDVAKDSAQRLRRFSVGGTALLVVLLTIGAFTIRRDAAVTRDLLGATLRSIGGGVITTNRHGEITFMNDVAEKLTGWRENEALTQPLNDVFILRDGKTGASASISLRKVLLEYGIGKGFTNIFLRGKAGRETPINYIISPIRGVELFTGTVLIFRDNTERHNAERALEQANADLERVNVTLKERNTDLEQFAYAASHDLREPLRSIAIYCDMLAESVPENLQTQNFKGFVRAGVRQIETLIDAFLAYARAVTPEKVPHRAVSMQVVLEDAVAALHAAIQDSGARITATHTLPEVIGNQTQLIQVLQNLIGNAIKYRGEKSPQIQVSAERENDYYHFHVRDNGIGFDPGHATHIFGIFKRLHTKAKYPGTGIGLALCKRIVEMHGGHIWAESEQGKGSTFHFTLAAAGAHSPCGHTQKVEPSFARYAHGL